MGLSLIHGFCIHLNLRDFHNLQTCSTHEHQKISISLQQQEEQFWLLCSVLSQKVILKKTCVQLVSKKCEKQSKYRRKQHVLKKNSS